MAKALLGHVGGPDPRMVSEMRRLQQRVRDLEAELVRLQDENDALSAEAGHELLVRDREREPGADLTRRTITTKRGRHIRRPSSCVSRLVTYASYVALAAYVTRLMPVRLPARTRLVNCRETREYPAVSAPRDKVRTGWIEPIAGRGACRCT